MISTRVMWQDIVTLVLKHKITKSFLCNPNIQDCSIILQRVSLCNPNIQDCSNFQSMNTLYLKFVKRYMTVKQVIYLTQYIVQTSNINYQQKINIYLTNHKTHIPNIYFHRHRQSFCFSQFLLCFVFVCLFVFFFII